MARIFLETEAAYYCANYKSSAGKSLFSIKEFCETELKGKNLLKEGSVEFEQYRDCSLRNVERLLFLAASNYRLSHRMMIASSANWAYVTLYYTAYYAAGAILEMFGVRSNSKKCLIDVQVGNRGSQQLSISRHNTSGKGGSHQIFWDAFYTSIQPLHSWMSDPSLLAALTPINNDSDWMTINRNIFNYDTFHAFDLNALFKKGFKSNQFPVSLPQKMNTQFKVTEALITIAFQYANKFKVATDALNSLSSSGSRKEKINRFIFNSRLRGNINAATRNRIFV